MLKRAKKFSLTAEENRFTLKPEQGGNPDKRRNQMKKALTVILIAALALTSPIFAGGAKEEGPAEVYYLNFKPEIAEVYTNEVIPAFEEATGIPLKVVTAASNQYEPTLRSEITKSEPPVIFQVNGPVGLQTWKDYAAPLEDTSFYGMLSDKSMALSADDHVLAIPYTVEGYGIIYNDAIMRAYFALPDKAVSISSAEEINSFETLKAVVEDMTKHKDELGIQGVFASTSMAPGSDWRWQTHLFNVPLWAEFRDRSGDSSTALAAATEATEFEFRYNENFRKLWDLYLDNSVSAKGLLGGKNDADSMAEFALGQAAMVQNGNWGASQILGVPGNTVADSDIKFLPLYMDLDGEEGQGICVGTENYLCINKNASAEAQANAIAFLEWLFSSDEGKNLVTNRLGFITPFNTFTEDEQPTDPLARQVTEWMANTSVKSVPWTFAGIPSEQWKSDFGSALLEYINGNMEWAEAAEIARSSWAREAQLAGR